MRIMLLPPSSLAKISAIKWGTGGGGGTEGFKQDIKYFNPYKKSYVFPNI